LDVLKLDWIYLLSGDVPFDVLKLEGIYLLSGDAPFDVLKMLCYTYCTRCAESLLGVCFQEMLR
jgi:hypothetical protein